MWPGKNALSRTLVHGNGPLCVGSLSLEHLACWAFPVCDPFGTHFSIGAYASSCLSYLRLPRQAKLQTSLLTTDVYVLVFLFNRKLVQSGVMLEHCEPLHSSLINPVQFLICFRMEGALLPLPRGSTGVVSRRDDTP